MKEKYRSIWNYLKENRGKELIIERKYLPEIVHEDGWQINSFDELPELKPIVEKTIRHWGIFIKYDKDLILIFVPKNFSLEPDYNYSI